MTTRSSRASDWTPYAGRRVRGAIERTLVRGAVVYEDGRVVGQPGWGTQAVPHGRPDPRVATGREDA